MTFWGGIYISLYEAQLVGMGLAAELIHAERGVTTVMAGVDSQAALGATQDLKKGTEKHLDGLLDSAERPKRNIRRCKPYSPGSWDTKISKAKKGGEGRLKPKELRSLCSMWVRA